MVGSLARWNATPEGATLEEGPIRGRSYLARVPPGEGPFSVYTTRDHLQTHATHASLTHLLWYKSPLMAVF